MAACVVVDDVHQVSLSDASVWSRVFLEPLRHVSSACEGN